MSNYINLRKFGKRKILTDKILWVVILINIRKRKGYGDSTW
jgi:hypothetical protein